MTDQLLPYEVIQKMLPMRKRSPGGWHLAMTAAAEKAQARKHRAGSKQHQFHMERMNAALDLMTDEERQAAREANSGK